MKGAQYFLLSLFFCATGWAAGRSGGGGDFTAKYQQRQGQRFDIISYLFEQKKIRAAQDAKYGAGGGGKWFYPDAVAYYARATPTVQRNGTEIVTAVAQTARLQFLLNGLITEGSQRRLINIDVGSEGFYDTVTGFKESAASGQMAFENAFYGGGLILRPFGRSSQDTGLMFKGGYLSGKEKGFWFNDSVERSLSSMYYGGEAKLYLLSFLGARAEYISSVDASSAELGGKWRMQKTTYGGFVEVLLLAIEAHIYTTEWRFSSDSTGVETKDTSSGVGFSASMFF